MALVKNGALEEEMLTVAYDVDILLISIFIFSQEDTMSHNRQKISFF